MRLLQEYEQEITVMLVASERSMQKTILSVLHSKMFTNRLFSKIFEICEHLINANKPVNVYSICELLSPNELEDVRYLQDSYITNVNYRYYVEKVQQAYFERLVESAKTITDLEFVQKIYPAKIGDYYEGESEHVVVFIHGFGTMGMKYHESSTRELRELCKEHKISHMLYYRTMFESNDEFLDTFDLEYEYFTMLSFVRETYKEDKKLILVGHSYGGLVVAYFRQMDKKYKHNRILKTISLDGSDFYILNPYILYTDGAIPKTYDETKLKYTRDNVSYDGNEIKIVPTLWPDIGFYHAAYDTKDDYENRFIVDYVEGNPKYEIKHIDDKHYKNCYEINCGDEYYHSLHKYKECAKIIFKKFINGDDKTRQDIMKGGDKKESESICVLTPPDVEYFIESMSDADKHLLALDWKPKIDKIYRANTIYGIPYQGFIWIDGNSIECLYVSPKYRNKGLASRLMIHALAHMMGFSEIHVKSKKENTAIEKLLKKFDFECVKEHDYIKEWVMKYEYKVMPTNLEWMNNDQRSFRNFMIEGSHVVIIGEAHVKHKTDIINWDTLAQQEISVVLAEDQVAYPDESLIPYFDGGKHRNLPNMKYVAYDRRTLMNKNEDMKPYRRWFVERKIPDEWHRGEYPYDNESGFKENLKKISQVDCVSAHELFLLPEDRITNIQPKTHAFFSNLHCNYDNTGALDTCLADIPMCSYLEKYINEKMPVIVIYCGDLHTLILEKFILDNYKPWMIPSLIFQKKNDHDH